MSPTEVVWRAVDEAHRASWARRQVRPGESFALPPGLVDPRDFPSRLPAEVSRRVPVQAAAAVVSAARSLLEGDWTVLGTPRPDILAPDWFRDPVTGRRAPEHELAFRIDHRDEAVTGNVKSVWELSRHHHLTMLATAWWLTHDEQYAEAVDRQLRSWWTANPFLSGVHWTSGIELGVRLLSWVWIRRLLDEWPKVTDLFESNETALAQIWWHQRHLQAFRSRGSSANNHAVLEAAGRAAAACAFPWYAESARWRDDALEEFQSTFAANTFPTGLNRELASDYHRFVAETGLLVAAEAAAAGCPVSGATWERLTACLDAAAAVVDDTGRPPRQGDGDEGRALVVDDPHRDPWSLLLDLGATVVGAQEWWPVSHGSVLATAVGALAGGSRAATDRPTERPTIFPDGGMTILRSRPGDEAGVWCRCDGGPHGFLSIAAHAHADALSIEVRQHGVDILADPGTYCYHGDPEWRSYFRSTRAHNTVEVDGRNQSEEGGPFLWTRHTSTVVGRAQTHGLPVQTWSAHHDGYGRPGRPVRHARTVQLDVPQRRIRVEDSLTGVGRHSVAVFFHLGPEVTAELAGNSATLSWPGTGGTAVHGRLELPAELVWTAHRGEIAPILGWYSPGFGERVPSTTLAGRGVLDRSLALTTVLLLAGGVGGTEMNGSLHE